MEMLPTMPSLFNRRSQEFVIARLGDPIWEEVCDTIPCDRPFQVHDLIGRVRCLKRYSERTQNQYIHAVLRNVIEQWAHLPPEEGTPPIKKIKRGWYTLPTTGDHK